MYQGTDISEQEKAFNQSVLAEIKWTRVHQKLKSVLDADPYLFRRIVNSDVMFPTRHSEARL